MHKPVLAALAGAVLVAPHIARSQTATPAVPEVMPFDIPYGTPIGLDDAQKAIIASVNEAKKHNRKMAVAVVDPAGNLVAAATMDGTQYASIPIARAKAKARTAALFRRPGKVFADAINGASGGIATQDGMTARGGLAAPGGSAN